MVNPTPFFATDFFGTKDVTLPRLQKFALVAIQRLTPDNPGGVFMVLAADLSTYYEALFGDITAIDAGISQRRTSAQQLWRALANLQDQPDEDKDLIMHKSKKTPAIRLAFFPNGRQEYRQADLLTADLLFQRGQTAAPPKPSGPSLTPRFTLASTSR